MLKQILAKEEIYRCLVESDFESCFSFPIKEDVRLYLADKGDDIYEIIINAKIRKSAN